MSWQLAAFALLGIALVGGFAWYERSRPDARIVALVGTLAAFAALGRIAFAAVPNVKPTTDIVLLAGFALGGGPGFAVGAIAGLTSNFFFGQGPWTPWQMAAWGATGVLGAGLARVCGRRGGSPSIGRWPLAIVCCVAGFAFTAVQDAGDWVTYSDHSLAALGAYVGSGLGFDGVYAAACLGFALAFGPALLRSIQRFARRIEVRWIPPAPLVVVAVAAAGLLAGHPGRARAADAGASGAAGWAGPVSYLRHAQNADGGLGAAPGQPSAQLFAGWAALGLASAGVDVATLRTAPGRPTLLSYVRAGAGAHDPGSLERTILVLRAAGASVTAVAGHDLIADLNGRFSADGAVSGQVNLTAFGLLALRSAGSATAARQDQARAWLVGQQDRDGGYGFAGRGGASDVDDTGAVLEALAGAPRRAPGRGAGAGSVRRAIARAVHYLRARQEPDGGFPSSPGMGSNAQSTAWAIQGLIAAGVDPASVRRRGSPTPVAYLRSLIAPDGAVRYARGETQTPVWVTGEALMALAGKPLPLPLPATVSVARGAPRAHPRRAPAARPRRVPAASGVARALAAMEAAVSVLPHVVVSRMGVG